MNTEPLARYRKNYRPKLEVRLVTHVTAKLGVNVTLARWDRCPKTYAEIPVFVVPQSHQQMARELGLTIA